MRESMGMNKSTAVVGSHPATDASTTDDSTAAQPFSPASPEEMDILSDESDDSNPADQMSVENYPDNLDKSQIPCKYLSRPEGFVFSMGHVLI
jgi:hypothetical protein